MATVELC